MSPWRQTQRRGWKKKARSFFHRVARQPLRPRSRLYKVDETLKILADHNLKVSGVCGMFSVDNDLSCNRAIVRQAAIDYLRREIPFTQAVGGSYLLVVPGAVGRPKAYDDVEFERSAETSSAHADWFVQYGVKAAIEPIRSAETSMVHTVADAKKSTSKP